jgi:hypothetical protein
MSTKESLGYYELKQHKPYFDEGYSELLNEMKQAKLRWLQSLRQTNWDTMNTVKHKDSRYFRNEKRGHLKETIKSARNKQ